MEEHKPTLIELWKTRKLRKKQEQLEMLKLDIEIAKLEKEIIEIKNARR